MLVSVSFSEFRIRTRGSPVLWKIFVKFEVAAGDLKKAKATFFRAINECPLVKGLFCKR